MAQSHLKTENLFLGVGHQGSFPVMLMFLEARCFDIWGLSVLAIYHVFGLDSC